MREEDKGASNASRAARKSAAGEVQPSAAWSYEVHELSEGPSAIVYDEHGQRIADHLSEGRAALIAAAPDLLEALRDLAQLEGGRFGSGVIKPGTYGAAVMGAARDAIAKAEGRS